jgi:hypothetical protein
MAKTNQSASMSLNSTDYKKILKGAGIAFGGAFLATVSAWLAAGSVNWGLFLTLCLPAALSTGINAVLKWYQGQ